MTIRVLIRNLLLIALTLCLGGLSPAVLAVLPQALGFGGEEERGSAETDAIGATATSVLRPSRTTPETRRRANICFAGERTRPLDRARFAASSLCALHVRIQV
jgi:hypothetical protein